MRYEKVYVEVLVRFKKEGGMRPVAVVWEDGRAFPIDKIIKTGLAPGKTGAVLPIRYVCAFGEKIRPLYFEKERWYVETAYVEA